MRFNVPSIITLSFLLLLFYAVTEALPICSHSRDCDDLNPATLDFCVTRYSFCVFVGDSDHEEQPAVVRQSAPLPVKLIPLRSILDETNATPLSLDEKLTVIKAVADILENVNPHRFLYLNIHKYDVAEQLSNFKESLIDKHRHNKTTTNVSFHRSMRRIFSGLNDFHTMYLPPSPLSVSFAFLGFFTKQFFSRDDTRRRRYLVNDVPADYQSLFNLKDSAFREGVELLTYDGIPIDDAVKKLGRQGSGSNSAARLDTGRFLLSFRFLALESLPSKRSVTVAFREKNGRQGKIDLPWVYMNIPNGTLSMIIGGVAAPTISTTVNAVQTSAFGESLDQRSHIAVRAEVRPSLRVVDEKKTKIQVKEGFESLFDAEILNTKVGRIGRLIIPSFNSSVTEGLVSELTRVLKLMPKRGLIMDVRRNPGGRGDYAKVVSELVSDKPIEDLPEIARATDLTRDIYLADGFVENAFPDQRENFISLRNAVTTALKVGEDFTGPFGNIFVRRPRPRRAYFGPLISVVDGLTYSAGDIFASLQVDQNISLLVGTSDNVGGGGASTTSYSYFSFLAPKVLRRLPGGVNFLTAISRFYRGGLFRGAMVESFGIKPDIRYYPTYNDAVNDDCDLFEFLAGKLVSMES